MGAAVVPTYEPVVPRVHRLKTPTALNSCWNATAIAMCCGGAAPGCSAKRGQDSKARGETRWGCKAGTRSGAC
eukprot:4236853-Alexandrium_andersonii.AAC.1